MDHPSTNPSGFQSLAEPLVARGLDDRAKEAFQRGFADAIAAQAVRGGAGPRQPGFESVSGRDSEAVATAEGLAAFKRAFPQL
jgi:hypothetical protein